MTIFNGFILSTSIDEFSTSSSNFCILFGSIIKFATNTFDTVQERPEDSTYSMRTSRLKKKPSVIAVMEWPTSMDEFSTSSSNIDVIFGSIIKFESSTFDTNQQRPENSKIWVRTRRFKNLTNVIGGASPISILPQIKPSPSRAPRGLGSLAL